MLGNKINTLFWMFFWIYIFSGEFNRFYLSITFFVVFLCQSSGTVCNTNKHNPLVKYFMLKWTNIIQRTQRKIVMYDHKFLRSRFLFWLPYWHEKNSTLLLFSCDWVWGEQTKTTRSFFISILFISIIRLKYGKNKHNMSWVSLSWVELIWVGLSWLELSWGWGD